MARIKANGIERDISLMVFDKDGLMFQSQPFWSHIGEMRIKMLRSYLNEDGIADWAKIFGLTMQNGRVVYTDPKGTLAVASPREEKAVTAGMLVRWLGLNWAAARSAAEDVFRRADAAMDLREALVPSVGFPDIFRRLRRAGIGYAVATSDTYQRVVDSLCLVGEKTPEIVVFPEMVEHGKPAPDMLNLISDRSGVPMDRIAMVGDSYVDVKMEHDAGAFGIGVPETAEMREEMKPFTSAIVENLNCIEAL